MTDATDGMKPEDQLRMTQAVVSMLLFGLLMFSAVFSFVQYEKPIAPGLTNAIALEIGVIAIVVVAAAGLLLKTLSLRTLKPEQPFRQMQIAYVVFAALQEGAGMVNGAFMLLMTKQLALGWSLNLIPIGLILLNFPTQFKFDDHLGERGRIGFKNKS